VPPRGVAASWIVARRGTVAGDSAPKLRGIAAVLARALSVAPDARYATAAELRSALTSLRADGARRWLIPAAAGATVTAVLALTLTALNRPAPKLDPAFYAALPFAGDTAVARAAPRHFTEALQ